MAKKASEEIVEIEETEAGFRDKAKEAWDKVAAAGRFVGRTAPLIIIVGGVITGSVLLWHHESTSQKYLVQVKLPDTVATSAREAKTDVKLNLLDPEAPEKLRELYEKNPWIADTYTFRRDFGKKQLIAEYAVREPAAQVRSRKGYQMIDAEGVVLSGELSPAPRPGLPIIYCSDTSTPKPGNKWGGNDALQALGVIKVLEEEKLQDRLNISQVVVRRTNYLDTTLQRRVAQPSIDLVTGSQATIRWGTYADATGTEVGTPEKIKMLKEILAAQAPMRQGNIIDIRTRNIFLSQQQ